MREVKFVADVMVGRLARWLRVLGFDVVYSNAFEDAEILRIARAENRIILTRDTGFAARCRELELIFIVHDDYRSQVRQVVAALDLQEFRVLSRCIECNTPLKRVEKDDVFERVPPYVYLTQDRFAACPSCQRVYWHGTHADEILKRIPVQL
jgi:uncharacterized protein with PIN domain